MHQARVECDATRARVNINGDTRTHGKLYLVCAQKEKNGRNEKKIRAAAFFPAQ